MENIKENPQKVEMDACVMCGKETKYPKTMDIEFRDYYVESAGQLCFDCYVDIYDNRKRNH